MYDHDETVDLSDIPEITDFSRARKNPFAGMFEDGYTIIAEHNDFDEITTVIRTKREKDGLGR